MFNFELGIKARSKVSGFTGVITSRLEHLNGCNRYWIEPRVGKDKKPTEGCWIDEVELEAVGNVKIVTAKSDNGGFASTVK
jgi:hypothetical protein